MDILQQYWPVLGFCPILSPVLCDWMFYSNISLLWFFGQFSVWFCVTLKFLAVLAWFGFLVRFLVRFC